MRRIRRIFPALILVITTCLIFGWFSLLASEYKQLAKHVLAGAGFVSNIILWSEVGYFDVAADTKILLHLWSLGIEEQFYIFWPLMIWLVWKRPVVFKTLLGFLLFISFYSNIALIQEHPSFTFYWPLTRIWELLIGAVGSYWVSERGFLDHKHTPHLSHLTSFIGLLFISISFFYINKEQIFPGWSALLPVVGSCLILVSGELAFFNKKILSNKLLVWIGLISYPLYLWHWPALSFLRIIKSEEPSYKLRFAAVILAIILAWMTYSLLEKPLRKKELSLRAVKKSCFFMLTIVIASLTIYLNDGIFNRSVTVGKLGFTHYNTKDLGYLACDEPMLKPGPALDYCFYAKGRNADAAIIGDSHADDKFHGIGKLDSMHSWMILGNGGCPPLYGVNINDGETIDCRERSEKVINWVVSNQDIKFVAISFFGNYYQDEPYAFDHVVAKSKFKKLRLFSPGEDIKEKKEIFYGGLERTVNLLLKSGKKVVIFTDVPELPFSPKSCVSSQKECTVNFSEVAVRQNLHRKMLEKLNQTHPELLIFDPIGIFCAAEICGFKNKEVVLYRDSHHLTIAGSDVYAKKFLEFLSKQ